MEVTRSELEELDDLERALIRQWRPGDFVGIAARECTVVGSSTSMAPLIPSGPRD
jgi:hypothetical protein